MLSRFPKQIKFIVGNEACERFSFYGMRSILVVFMVQHLLMKENHAKEVFHLFVAASYFLPLIGGYLADRFLGKYRVIMSLSLVYCLGHATLALWEGEIGLYAGLALIAIGAGGIKPCVSAFVGDQFDASRQDLMTKVFEIFYWSINFGGFFSALLIPKILPLWGPAVAFGIPGVLMALATLIFWMGSKHYVQVPPTGKENSMQFFGVLVYSILNLKKKQKGKSFLDVALPKYGAERVEGAKAAVGLFEVFLLVSMFWSLWDQQGSSWVLQGQKLDGMVLGYKVEASQLQALNPLFVLGLIPLFSLFVYPAIERMGIRVTPLRKMGAGMLITGLSFVSVGLLQILVDAGQKPSIAWQFFPYIFVSVAEIMVSITGLEFAYTQAPRAMKSTMMSLFLLTISAGNLFTAIMSYFNRFQGAAEFFFYATLMFVVALIFVVAAIRYKERSYLEGATSPG